MSNPTHLVFDTVAPESLLDEAIQILETIPCTQSGSASGKFYMNYKKYMFHRSSSLPIIQRFAEALEVNADKYYSTFKRKMNFDWIYLSHIEDPSQESSIPHRDGYWMNGQAHMTIQGNATIRVWQQDPYKSPDSKEGVEDLIFPDGTIWYLNGTEYHHTILPNAQIPKPGRLELLAPMDTANCDGYMECLSNCSRKYIDPANPLWSKIKKAETTRQIEAYSQGKASSPHAVGFTEFVD